MRCQTIRRWMHRSLDGELAEGDRQLLEQHLVSCSSCRNDWAAVRALHACLRRVPASFEPSESFEPTFWKKVYEREQESWLRRVLRGIDLLLPQPNFAQAAAVLLIAFLVGGSGGAVSVMARPDRPAVPTLSGFPEMAGLPATSVAASYLQAHGGGQSR